MPADLKLIQAYLENAQAVLPDNQSEHARFLLAAAQELLGPHLSHPAQAQYPMQLHRGIGLDRGKKRGASPNEDCVFATQGHTADGTLFGIFLVTDGAGGQILGQEAARLALRTCVDYLFPRLHNGRGLHGAALQSLLLAGVQEANRAVFLQNEAKVVLGGRMCTTITAMVIVGAEACVANVGDSRTYHYHPATGLTQITRDHSLVADLVRSKGIARDDMRTHPQRNVINRGLGKQVEEEIDIFSGPVHIDDLFLLCSDGLWEMVPDARIKEILSQALCPASTMSEQLVADALASGGLDNIAALVVQVRGIDVAGEQTIVAPAYTLAPLPS